MKHKSKFPAGSYGLKQTGQLTKFSLVTGMLGGALDSPALKTASSSSAVLISPMANLSATGMTVDILGKLNLNKLNKENRKKHKSHGIDFDEEINVF